MEASAFRPHALASQRHPVPCRNQNVKVQDLTPLPSRRERARPRALPQSPNARPRTLTRCNPWPGTRRSSGASPIHPGGMAACSRWLSEATPPEPGPDSAIDPGRGRSPSCDIRPHRPWRMPCVSFAFIVAIQPPAILPRCRGLSRKEHKEHKGDGRFRIPTSCLRLPTTSGALPKPKCQSSRSDPIASIALPQSPHWRA
jgi:hypothetical protein